jgi:hypothetical protein
MFARPELGSCCRPCGQPWLLTMGSASPCARRIAPEGRPPVLNSLADKSVSLSHRPALSVSAELAQSHMTRSPGRSVLWLRFCRHRLTRKSRKLRFAASHKFQKAAVHRTGPSYMQNGELVASSNTRRMVEAIKSQPPDIYLHRSEA